MGNSYGALAGHILSPSSRINPKKQRTQPFEPAQLRDLFQQKGGRRTIRNFERYFSFLTVLNGFVSILL